MLENTKETAFLLFVPSLDPQTKQSPWVSRSKAKLTNRIYCWQDSWYIIGSWISSEERKQTKKIKTENSTSIAPLCSTVLLFPTWWNDIALVLIVCFRTTFKVSHKFMLLKNLHKASAHFIEDRFFKPYTD